MLTRPGQLLIGIADPIRSDAIRSDGGDIFMTNHKDWGPVAEMPKDAINQHTARPEESAAKAKLSAKAHSNQNNAAL